MKKNYNSGSEETYCDLYDSPSSFTRHLVKGTVEISEPCLSIIGGTTLSTFKQYFNDFTTFLDSGFFARFLFTYPTRFKVRMPRKAPSEEETTKLLKLGIRIQNFYTVFSSQKKIINFKPTKEAFKILDNWEEKYETYIQEKETHERIASLYHRASENCLKIAAIIEMGFYNFTIKQNSLIINKINGSSQMKKTKEKLLKMLSEANREGKEKQYSLIVSIINNNYFFNNILYKRGSVCFCELLSDFEAFFPNKKQRKTASLTFVNYVNYCESLTKQVFPDYSNLKVFEFPITTFSMRAAVYYLQNFFIPQALKVMKNIELSNNVNTLQLVFTQLMKLGGRADRSQLMRYCRLKKKDFQECIDTLVEMARLRCETEVSGTRERLYYVALEPDKKIDVPVVEVPVFMEEF